MEEQEKIFKECARDLRQVPNVSQSYRKDDNKEEYVFTSLTPNALTVSLLLRKAEGYYVELGIEGVDTSYWHTAEVESLDYHIELAKAALRGDVVYGRSPLFRFKEVCFKLNESWECTRTSGNNSYHYITTRKRIR